jgi:hypothetical protein
LYFSPLCWCGPYDPPDARVDTPYGRGCQVARSAPTATPTGTLVTAAQGGISVLRVARIATWACTVAADAPAIASGLGRCLLRTLALIVVAAAWCR